MTSEQEGLKGSEWRGSNVQDGRNSVDSGKEIRESSAEVTNASEDE